jgi:CHAD domain-containing protein
MAPEEATMDTALAATSVTQALTRLVARYLKDATAACKRLADPADAEALHDFRVALRRLRSLLRAYRPWLGDALPGKLRRKIGKLARRTGPARDAEVQLAWLREALGNAGESERPGVQWLVDDLTARRDEEYRVLRAALPAGFPRLRRRLLQRLDRATGAAAESFGAAAAQRLRESAADFQTHLERVHGAADEAEIHRARIAGKHLRYLLEPLADELPGGEPLVKELRALQDRMGELHDHQVLGAELLQASERAGAARLRRLVAWGLQGDQEQPARPAAGDDESAGFLLLARLLQQARLLQTGLLLEGIQAGDMGRFLEHLQAACDQLQGLAESTARSGE